MKILITPCRIPASRPLWIPPILLRLLVCFHFLLLCSIAPQVSAAAIPATVQAIRIPEENLAALLPGGLDMETIDPAVMRRIEKAIQLEKAFVEGKWEGNLSKTEENRIEPKEEPVIQFNNQWNMGMEGEVEILESSPDGHTHSCKIRLGLFRKGMLADVKAPNFDDRLARRTRRVYGVFQLTDGTHTLLAALPQTLTDGDAHTLLFIVSLGKPGATPPADPSGSGLVTIETFRMPMDDWHRIPQAMRDDHRQLLEKCRATAGRGKIERLDRISSCATSKDKLKMDCSSVVELSYPTSFGIRDGQLDTKSWEYRMAGSSFEAERVAGPDGSHIRISYEKIAQLPAWHPTLKAGSERDVSLSRFPIFGGILYGGSMLGVGQSRTCLLGIAPSPAGGEKPTHLALMFASATCPGIPVSTKVSEIMIEILVARGPSGPAVANAESHIKELLARPGSIESITATTVVSGRSVVSSAMEWIYPMETLGGGDSVVVPNQFNRLNQGTELDVEYQGSTGDDGVRVNLHLEHSLRKPLLPMATNHGASRLKPEKPVTCDLSVKERLTLTPGAWTAIKEIPLEPILGADDKTAKGQSCHVFARLLRSATRIPSSK